MQYERKVSTLELKSNFGNRLKEVRSSKNLTLEEFSELVKVPAQTLNRYELGQRTPKIDVAFSIADKLQINPMWLAGYDYNKDDELIILAKYLESIGYDFEFVYAKLENGNLEKTEIPLYDTDGTLQLPSAKRRVPCIKKGELLVILTQEQFLEFNDNIKYAIDYELNKHMKK